MISYVTRKNVDEIKYNNCIKNALNSRVYAYSWYLDCVADNWDALILNDYEAVMPLPWRTKYFIKYIYPPAWTQQLGIFSNFDIDAKLTQQFIQSIPKKFKKVTIQFNSGNDLSLFKIQNRVNYILPLNKSYEEVFNGLNKNRRRVLKKANLLTFTFKNNVSVQEYFSFHKNLNLNNYQREALKRLVEYNNFIKISGITINDNLQVALVYTVDSKRVTYLFPVANKAAKEMGLPTLLIDNIIQHYANSNLILDFEGSMLKGVADFYKSFGSTKETYFLFRRTFELF